MSLESRAESLEVRWMVGKFGAVFGDTENGGVASRIYREASNPVGGHRFLRRSVRFMSNSLNAGVKTNQVTRDQCTSEALDIIRQTQFRHRKQDWPTQNR
jgi:hypothetical protein